MGGCFVGGGIAGLPGIFQKGIGFDLMQIVVGSGSPFVGSGTDITGGRNGQCGLFLASVRDWNRLFLRRLRCQGAPVVGCVSPDFAATVFYIGYENTEGYGGGIAERHTGFFTKALPIRNIQTAV